jgi:arabinose-5-phosphate isomerase
MTIDADLMNSDLLLIGRRAIEKEAQALAALAPTLGADFVEACSLIFKCRGTILLTGMGKSGLVARKWASTFSSTGTKSYFIDPAEAPHGDLGILHESDLVIALSFSGETEELGYVLRHAKELGLTTIGVTGKPQSSLARQTSLVLSLELSEEACPLGLAPTTSTTLMMALGDALAVTLIQMRGFTEKDFARLHPGGSLGRKLWLRVESLMHSGDSIPTVAVDAVLENVLVEMTRKRLGLAVVMTGREIAGVITDGDLRRYFQKNGLNSKTRAADILTANPKMISANALAVEARELMERNSIHQLLITDDERRLVGVIHLQDLLHAKVL